jgi:dihydropteroate synthase
MQRKRYFWKLREGELPLGEHTLAGGVVPVVPLPAPDGNRYDDADRAYARALQLEEQGAGMVLLLSEVMRTGGVLATAEEQHRRLAPVLKRLRHSLSIPIAAGTGRASTAERALDLGASIVYDPSGLVFDPALAKVCSNAGAPLILAHMRGTPSSWAKQPPSPDPVGYVISDLEAGLHRARMGHLEKNQLMVDPGLGVGKRREETAQVAARMFALNRLELPICVNTMGAGLLVEERPGASAAIATAAVMAAAHIVLAFDIELTLAAVQAADIITRAREEDSPPPKEAQPASRMRRRPAPQGRWQRGQ